MKQITFYVYQSIDGCPVRLDKQVDDAVLKADCNLTEKERVRFITGDAAAELARMKAEGEGVIIAYGEGIVATLLNNRLADEIVVITLPKVKGGSEKALPDLVKDSAAWVVCSCRVLDGEKVRTVYGRV